MSITAALVAGAASGAAGGLMSQNKGTEMKYDYHPLDEQFKLASGSLIPIYLKLITGGVPNFLKRYLNQTQSTALNQAQNTAQQYLRQIGSKGMAFGPQQADAISKIFQEVNPALIGAMNQVRMGSTNQAFGAMNKWAGMRPMMSETTQKSASVGEQAGAGALEGFSYGMGQKTTPQLPAGAGAGAPSQITTVPMVQQQLQQMNPYMPNATDDYMKSFYNQPQNPYQSLYYK